MNMLKHYLESLNILGQVNSNTKFKYKSYPELILQEGFWMLPSPLSDCQIKLEAKTCYYNCYSSVKAHPKKFTYCEGYAVPENIEIPIAHAWLLDENGLIVEPTLRSAALEYYGIPFESDWFIRHIESRGGKSYSLLEGNHLENFSFLREGFPHGALRKPQ